MEDQQDQTAARLQLAWPEWLSEVTRRAAKDRTVSVSAYIRQAVLERLERDGYRKEGRP